MQALAQVGYFVVHLLFTLTLFLLWSRVMLRYFRISSLHPIAQVVRTFTNPLVHPIEQIITPKKSSPSRYDIATLIVIVAVESIKYLCVGLIVYQSILPISYLFIFVLADCIVQPLNLFFYFILIQVIMSWVNPRWNHPLAQIIYTVNAPLLQWGRKIIPNISGFDFSPFVILVLLQVVSLFIHASMPLPIL